MSLTTSIDITRKRGDTFPFRFEITQDGAALNITSYTFLMTVDPSSDPPDDTTKNFQLAGVITDAAGGAFEFRPTAGNMNLTPNVYFYDVQMTDSASYITTVVKGKLTIQQDITK